jgi:sugar phosphate isomerase/epimerase
MPASDPYRIGLKLYSTNTDLIGEARALKGDFFDYVELYVLPGSHDDTVRAWQEFDIPYVIHAPHSFHGVNLARRELWETNAIHIREARDFADALNADLIIVHGGNNGTIEETIEQIKMINDARVIIENKPRIGIHNEVCIGWSPREFMQLQKANLSNGFALDFTHAICAARAINTDEWKFINSLLVFEPKIFHLSDIDSTSIQDMHLNLGHGTLNIAKILSLIPDNGFITIETPRRVLENLSEYVADVKYVQSMMPNND